MKWCSAEMEEKGDEAYFVEAKDRQWINNRGLSSMTTGRKKNLHFFVALSYCHIQPISNVQKDPELS